MKQLLYIHNYTVHTVLIYATTIFVHAKTYCRSVTRTNEHNTQQPISRHLGPISITAARYVAWRCVASESAIASASTRHQLTQLKFIDKRKPDG